MSLTFEDNEQRVISNSDIIFKKEVEWIKEVPYEEPNEYEINLNKNFLTPEQLLKEEEVIIEKTQEELDKEYRDTYILRVKVIAMHKMGKSIISNPSYWKHTLKQQLIKEMQYVIDNNTEEELKEKFNFIVNENLFDSNLKYETFPLKRS